MRYVPCDPLPACEPPVGALSDAALLTREPGFARPFDRGSAETVADPELDVGYLLV